MTSYPVRRALICCAVLISGAIALSHHRLWSNSQRPPKLVLWAWERSEDLSFIDPSEISVAYLAGTIRLRGGAVEAVPRLQPLKVPPKTRMSAVVRLESAASASTPLTAAQREQAVSAILWMTNRPDTVGTQIDFDARSSEHAFYGDLLRDLRRRLSAGVSTDEPLPRLHYGRRVYIFHPRSWTAASAANILREVKSWQ